MVKWRIQFCIYGPEKFLFVMIFMINIPHESMEQSSRKHCIFSNIKKSGTFVNLKEIIFANISNTLQDGVSLLLDLLGKTYMCFRCKKKLSQ